MENTHTHSHTYTQEVIASVNQLEKGLELTMTRGKKWKDKVTT